MSQNSPAVDRLLKGIEIESNRKTALRRLQKSMSGMGQTATASAAGTNTCQTVTIPQAIANPCSAAPSSTCYPNAMRLALQAFLPPELMPSNVGNLSEVAWLYQIPFNFAFGLNPTLSSATFQQQNVQIPQDGGFLALMLSVAGDDFSPACMGGPYTVNLTDAQSAQQFMNNYLPIRMLAYKSHMSLMVTPMYFSPSATITAKMSTWLPQGQNMTTFGSGNLQVLLTGLMTAHTGDQDIMSNVYSNTG